jgi:hypothetical protein
VLGAARTRCELSSAASSCVRWTTTPLRLADVAPGVVNAANDRAVSSRASGRRRRPLVLELSFNR